MLENERRKSLGRDIERGARRLLLVERSKAGLLDEDDVGIVECKPKERFGPHLGDSLTIALANSSREMGCSASYRKSA